MVFRSAKVRNRFGGRLEVTIAAGKSARQMRADAGGSAAADVQLATGRSHASGP
jgi:hypothetical protein